MTNNLDQKPTALADWRPVYWEPVAGSGERLMAGVVGRHGETWQARRALRNDVLESLYGDKAAGAIKLIDHALATALLVAQRAGLEALKDPLMGLSPGALRQTAAHDFTEVLKQAALLYSSLTNLDAIDDPDEDANSKVEDGNRQFGSEVRSTISALRPDLKDFLNIKTPVVPNGVPVRFGFYSKNLVVQFSVLHPVRQPGSVSTARSKIFELQRAQEIGGIKRSALVFAVPPEDSAVFGEKQRAALIENIEEIRREAIAVDVIPTPVTTVIAGAHSVINLQLA